MHVHNQGSPWHGYFQHLVNVCHFEVIITTSRNLSLYHIFTTLDNCKKIQYLKLSTTSFPFYIPHMVLPLLGAHKNLQHITLDAISTSDYNICLETFLAPTQYPALKHIVIDVDFDEPITPINLTIPNIPQPILGSTSLTLLVADIVPTSLDFGALLLGLPSLQQLSLGNIQDLPRILPTTAIPLLINYRGPMTFLTTLIASRQLKNIETWCGDEDTATRFLKAAYGKMINKMSYRHHPAEFNQAANDCEVICALLHTRTTHIKCVNIMANPGNAVSKG